MYKTQQHATNVEFNYICIKREFFDPNMIYLNYYQLKKKKYIEIIYKSPSIFLEGLFFKTPPIELNNITIYRNDKIPRYLNKTENIEIKLHFNMDNPEHAKFITILNNLDKYLIEYMDKCKTDIERELQANYNDYRKISEFEYSNTIKQSEADKGIWQMSLRSYIDKRITSDIYKKKQNLNKAIGTVNETDTAKSTKYVFTFNISNIYFGSSHITPLIKTNDVLELNE